VSVPSIHRTRNLTSVHTELPSSQLLKGKPIQPQTARLFAHLTSSPNTCASYIQGQEHSPSLSGCAISQPPTARDLTTPQTFPKCLGDYTNRQVRAAACFQFHDPRVEVRPASLPTPPPLTPPLALYLPVRGGPLFRNGKFPHL